MSEWAKIPQGTIVDSDIIRLSLSGLLITAGFDERGVKQATYELRASNMFYDVQSPMENKRRECPNGYLLRPHCCVVSIVQESISLPGNVLGRILTKGKLFSIGILPVNTYADPGFEGRLGITLWNASHRYLIIQPGEAIAKIEFSVLPKSVNKPYRVQHGYDTEIWPVATNLYADTSDCSVALQLRNTEREIGFSHGSEIEKLAREVRYLRKVIPLQIFITLTVFALVFVLYKKVDIVWNLSLSVGANLLTNLLVFVWPRLHAWRVSRNIGIQRQDA